MRQTLKYHMGETFLRMNRLKRLRRQAKVIAGRRQTRQKAVQQMIAPAVSGATFMGALAKNPRSIGACVPSSKVLSKMMAAHVPLPVDGVVVEFGGGTGKVTEALLRHGIPPEQLVTVEQSPALANLLQKRFPKIQVIEGDAGNCYDKINGHPRVHAVVSGLPLLSLPEYAVQNIICEIEQMLAPDGVLIQFTYRLKGQGPLHSAFDSVFFHNILFNIPPARVEVFQKRG